MGCVFLWLPSCRAASDWLYPLTEGHCSTETDLFNTFSPTGLSYFPSSYPFYKWGGVFASCGCHSKLPLARWLKTREMYSLRVQKIRSLKSRCCQHWFLLEFLEENSPWFSHPIWQLLTILGVLWLVDMPPRSLPPSLNGHLLCISVYPFLSLTRTPSLD